MAKNVFIKAGVLTALVAIGWLAFFLGVMVRDLLPIGSAILLTIARVLP
jgi:hypothetical protein